MKPCLTYKYESQVNENGRVRVCPFIYVGLLSRFIRFTIFMIGGSGIRAQITIHEEAQSLARKVTRQSRGSAGLKTPFHGIAFLGGHIRVCTSQTLFYSVKLISKLLAVFDQMQYFPSTSVKMTDVRHSMAQMAPNRQIFPDGDVYCSLFCPHESALLTNF